MRTIFFDLETKYSAEEVGGWSNIIDMGMSCGVLGEGNQFHVYLEHQVLNLIQHLQQADLIVGFNHIKFDLRVLAGYADSRSQRDQLYQELCALNHCDMLLEVEKLLGHRLKLDSLARATLSEGKSADGLQALQWYREGRMDLIIEYCKQDVDVTRRLYQYGREHGKLLYDSKSGLKEVLVDWVPSAAVSGGAEQMALF